MNANPNQNQPGSNEADREAVVTQDHDVSREVIRPDPITEADKVPGKETNRPGFDLGGAKGDQEAGSGLGLGTDAREGGAAQRLPRNGS